MMVDLRELLDFAATALKWFIGRQERGRVRSQFSVWVFQYVVSHIETALAEEISFDFEEFDEVMVGKFEDANTGCHIIR